MVDKDKALEDAIQAEKDLALPRCDYGLVCELYLRAAELGSKETHSWLDRERKDAMFGGFPSKGGTWAENLHGKGTSGASLASRESFHDGYLDNR